MSTPDLTLNQSETERIRTALARLGLGTSLRRLGLFGDEQCLVRYTSTELALALTMSSGAMRQTLGAAAATRAVIEDNQTLLAELAAAGDDQGVATWAATMAGGTVEETLGFLAQITDLEEELHVARIVAARRHPGLVQPDWLWQVPMGHARIAAGLAAAIIAGRSDLLPSVTAFLERTPTVLMASDPDRLLAPLVLRSAVHPQTLLERFTGMYGEETLVAAARWHLEHNEPAPAAEIATRVRPLSEHADFARQILASALLDLGRHAEARQQLNDITDPDIADAVQLRLAEIDPVGVDVATLTAIGLRCPTSRPDTCFAAIRNLLQRKELAQARMIAQRRQHERWNNPALAETFAVILKSA